MRSPEQLYGVPKQENGSTAVLQLWKMISEVEEALMVNLCLGFSSSVQANGQVSNAWILLTSDNMLFSD